jgi:tetratricopeptide (TPR) repeat protein
MNRRPVLSALWLVTVIVARGYTQDGETGDPAAAEKYVQWVQGAIAEDRWREAEAALERAADYADVSSDLSYLLALVRSHQGRPRGAVLEAAVRALGTDRWRFYAPEAGRLLAARTLITLRSFSEALNLLGPAPQNADALILRLLALKGLSHIPAFRETLALALERYPRDPRPARLLCEYAAGRTPGGNEQEMINLVLRRLPFLLEADPELAYLAAPFIRDTGEARRLVEAYRAGGAGRDFRASPASLPAALGLGLIDEDQGIRELFSPPGTELPAAGEVRLDKSLLRAVWTLLRDGRGREFFIRNLLRFSGVIVEDRDQDGCMEGRTFYRDGMIAAYSYDQDQDGLPELEMAFTAGVPAWAEVVLLPGSARSVSPVFALPLRDEERIKARVRWERYPAVFRAELEGAAYILRPLELLYAPVGLTPFLGISDFLYPEAESPVPGLSRRILVMYSLFVERPGNSGGIEQVELDRGIPRRAVETLEGRTVSVTEFRLGRPYTQRIDLDLDGRMETVRRFRSEPEAPVPEADYPWEYVKILEFSESDWDGDGIFEYGETYLPNNTLIRSWDMDKDNIREYTETTGEAGDGEKKQN